MTPTFVNADTIHGLALANTIVATIKQHAATLRALDAGAPTYAFVTLLSVRGATLLTCATEAVGTEYAAGPYLREVIDLPEVQLSETDAERPLLLKPILTMLWNAFGVGKCEAYDGQGRWIGAG